MNVSDSSQPRLSPTLTRSSFATHLHNISAFSIHPVRSPPISVLSASPSFPPRRRDWLRDAQVLCSHRCGLRRWQRDRYGHGHHRALQPQPAVSVSPLRFGAAQVNLRRCSMSQDQSRFQGGLPMARATNTRAHTDSCLSIAHPSLPLSSACAIHPRKA